MTPGYCGELLSACVVIAGGLDPLKMIGQFVE
jgi:hypothetical protein